MADNEAFADEQELQKFLSLLMRHRLPPKKRGLKVKGGGDPRAGKLFLPIPKLPAGRGQDPGCGTNGLMNARDVDSGAVKHATLGAEVILHIHNDHDGHYGIWLHRFGSPGGSRAFAISLKLQESAPEVIQSTI
jgi:hypothetical protein